MTIKIVLCLPYILSQGLLLLIIVGLRLNTNISSKNGYIVGGFIAMYGALLIFSYDIRRKWWPKNYNLTTSSLNGKRKNVDG